MTSYAIEDLYTLQLAPLFIEKIANHFKLTYVDYREAESNLCFAESNELRAEYRITFSKTDVLNNIFLQLPGETFNLERDTILFQEGFFLNKNIG